MSKPLLHRASSLVLNAPGTFTPPANKDRKANASSARVNLKEQDEVVPDSEEERLRSKREHATKIIDIIEISSDDDENEFVKEGIGAVNLTDEDDPFLDPISVTSKLPAVKSKGSEKLPRAPQTPRSRRVVYSSSSEESETEPDAVGVAKNDTGNEPEVSAHPRPTLSHRQSTQQSCDFTTANQRLPLYADDDGDEPWNIDDGSVLVLNEPKSARKPTRINSVTSTPVGDRNKSTPSRPAKSILHALPLAIQPSSARTIITSPSTLASSPVSASPRKRPSKKAEAAARQEQLEIYTQELFDELNKVIFAGGIPSATKLNWNKRLTSTAGRAKWHKARNGEQTSEIELSVKILTEEARIRSTLSHEMCHLAAWIIDEAPNENHGRIWKAWAHKVTKVRPDIRISTKHRYEIEYKYTWECERCQKTYGRFSKSIRPDEYCCGACKGGKLIPQFTERARKAPPTKAQSQMGAETPQGSPLSVLRAPPAADNGSANDTGGDGDGNGAQTPGPLRLPRRLIDLLDPDDDVDADEWSLDVENLTVALGGVSIGARRAEGCAS